MQSRSLEELELKVQVFQQEKEAFKKELTLAKEKVLRRSSSSTPAPCQVLSLESIVNSVGTSGGGEEGQAFEVT